MRRFSVVLAAAALCVLFAFSGSALAADRGPVVTVGSEKVGESELIRLIIEQAGANEMMTPFVIAQLSLEDRTAFAEQVVMALLLSEAAKTKGVQMDPAIASRLRWNTVNILAQAYISSVSAKWDVSNPAMEAWFAANQKRYEEPEAVFARHILVPTEAEATNILLEVFGKGADFGEAAAKYSQDTGSAQNGGELGWVPRGATVAEFETMAFSLSPGRIGGPVETRFGWHLIQVLKKRSARMPSMSEVIPQIREDMQQNYLALEVERLGGSLGVEIDQKIISTLGGFPAFSKTQ